MAGANIVNRARSADEAIERVRQQAQSRNALVFSHTVKGDICALADVATQCNVRIVISYPAGSVPHFRSTIIVALLHPIRSDRSLTQSRKLWQNFGVACHGPGLRPRHEKYEPSGKRGFIKTAAPWFAPS